MATKFELNDSEPAAPAGRVNVKFQYDTSGNVSAHVAEPAAAGQGQTPWLTDIDGNNKDLNNAGQIQCCSTLGGA